jgi:UDP:flavonoid glycosyltransferase YjiC (YdhE family)
MFIRPKPLPGTYHRLDSCVRDEQTASFEVPPDIAEGEGKLIYLSLGSLGSADVELMRRLITMLADSHHRVIVSKGPQHAELELAANMVGAEFLPQTKVLPLVDLVITHGGNNTITESFHFGTPMMVLPLFWDQHDNAQRVHETGFGVRMSTYTFSELEMFTAIDGLTSDAGLHQRLLAVSERLQADPGTVRAADLIERLATEKQPILA